MAFEKITESVLNVSALEDTPDLDADDLKAVFDDAGELIKDKFNTLVDDLVATSGAGEIGASALATGDTSNANIQAKLVYLLQQINNIVLGQIPDGTITKAKLNDTYSSLLAEKNGELQANLNADKLQNKALCDLNKVEYIECTNEVTTTSYSISSIPTMSSNAGTDGWVPSSSSSEGSYSSYKAFDNNDITYWHSESQTSPYIQVSVPVGKRLLPTSITYKIADFPTAQLEGSINGSDWEPIKSLTVDSALHTETITTTREYCKFRIIPRTSASSQRGTAYTFNLAGTLTTYTNNITATIPDFTYDTGNVANLKMPNNIDIVANSKININDLGAKDISNVIANGSRQYEYNGTSFALYSRTGAIGSCTSGTAVALGFTPAFVIVGTTIQTPTATGFTPTATGTYIAFR